MKRSIFRRFVDIGEGVGLAFVCGTAILTTLVLLDKAQAFDSRLSTVEAAISKLSSVEEKLDLVIQLLRDK